MELNSSIKPKKLVLAQAAWQIEGRARLWATVVCMGMVGAGAPALAQPQAQPPQIHALSPHMGHQWVQLSSAAEQEAAQDWLSVTLTHRAQSADAQTVQRLLKTNLDNALRHIRPKVKESELEVSSGSLSVYPRHNREGQVVGWQGSAELLVQGRDVAKVAATVAEVPGMTVSNMGFSLSRQAREAMMAGLRSEAIAKFKQTAQQVAKDFGFSGYRLREVRLIEGGEGPLLRPRLMMASEPSVGLSSAPLPVEPGKTSLQITVSGTVELQ